MNTIRRRAIWFACATAALTLVAACTGDGDEPASEDDSSADAGTDSVNSGNEAGGDAPDVAPPAATVGGDIAIAAGGQAVAADPDGPSAELVTIQEDPYIAATVYPRPDYEGNPWSQWGQGIALDDGRVISAIGDHLGADANSFLFVYDPEAGTVTRFADVLSTLDHEAGSWGYGKIHSQMVAPGDGGIWFTTYYGTRSDMVIDGSYHGDVLFRLDAETLELAPIAVPVPNYGVPSLATDGAGRIYGEAVDPMVPDEVYPVGGFFVFDTAAATTARFDENPDHDLFRNIMVDPDGTAWFAGQGGSLLTYEPADEAVVEATFELPGPLRASTAPTADGTIFGVTDEPGYAFFSVSPDGEVQELSSADDYVATVALVPDASALLYVPGAHGDAPLFDAAVITVDTATGEQTTIAELSDLVQDEFGLVLGGTYSITVDPERNQAHIGFNAGEAEDEPWGEVVFVVMDLP